MAIRCNSEQHFQSQKLVVVGALMELILMSGAGNVSGKGLGIRWSK
jgi:hypothetical protein